MTVMGGLRLVLTYPQENKISMTVTTQRNPDLSYVARLSPQHPGQVDIIDIPVLSAKSKAVVSVPLTMLPVRLRFILLYGQ